MKDPIFRRCEASAVVYWEATTSPPSVSRIVVDVPLPHLEGPRPDPESLAELLEAVRQLVERSRAHITRGEPSDPVLKSLAIVGALLEEVTP
jgi:predicted component of type VI protein secretion system